MMNAERGRQTLFSETLRMVFAMMNTIAAGLLLTVAIIAFGGRFDVGAYFDNMLGLACLAALAAPASVVRVMLADHPHIKPAIPYAANAAFLGLAVFGSVTDFLGHKLPILMAALAIANIVAIMLVARPIRNPKS